MWRVLDLFSGAGGAGAGYGRAGFEVVGVDLKFQPRYPFEFIQGDALAVSLEFVRGFDMVHASPPCQAHTSLRTMHNAKPHVDLIPSTRALLKAAGVPYVIENVIGAPIERPVMLCGTMFGLGTADGAELRRHRLFETSFPMLAPQCQHGLGGVLGVYGGHVRNRRRTIIGGYGEGFRDSRRKHDKGHPDFSIEDGRTAMGISWMTTAELSQAIPPAFTEYIARAWLAQREAASA